MNIGTVPLTNALQEKQRAQSNDILSAQILEQDPAVDLARLELSLVIRRL